MCGTIRILFQWHISCSQFLSYVADRDAKVFPRLMEYPPYPDVTIQKLEDLNHFAKKIHHRLDKIKKELKGTMIGGRKGIGGSGRFTEREFILFSPAHSLSRYPFYTTLSSVEQMVKFKWYYCTAITTYKTDLEAMYKAVWAVFKHKVKCHYYSNQHRLASSATLSAGIHRCRPTPRLV